MGAWADDGRVIEECIQKLQLFAEDEQKSPIVADLRETVYETAVRHGGEKSWQGVMAIYRRTDLSEEKRRCISALGRSREAKLVQNTFNWAFSKEVRLQDVPFAVSSICTSQQGRNLAWNYVTKNWDEFQARFQGAGSLMGSVLGSIAGSFSSPESEAEVTAFFSKHPCEPAERTIKQSLENIRIKSERQAREASQVKAWLEKEYPPMAEESVHV